MCILADKYDILPLKTLAEEKFSEEANKSNLSKKQLSVAAVRAYDTPGPARKICDHIVKLVIDNDLLAHTESAVELVMRGCVEFATDVAKAQRAHRIITPSTATTPVSRKRIRYIFHETLQHDAPLLLSRPYSYYEFLGDETVPTSVVVTTSAVLTAC